MKNKKGFTLIELLAVILILSIIMVMGITSIVPIIIRGKKTSLSNEALAFVDAAKLAHDMEIYPDSKLGLREKASYCFSMQFLKENNYYEKEDNNYYGSVYIDFDETNNKYNYTFWISNNDYHISGGTIANYDIRDGKGDGLEMTTCNGLASDDDPALPDPSDEGYTGIIYRNNLNVMMTNGSIDVINGYQWAIIGDYEGAPLYYDTEQQCESELARYKEEFPPTEDSSGFYGESCEYLNGTYGGIAPYYKSLPELLNQTYKLYCYPTNGATSCMDSENLYFSNEECTGNQSRTCLSTDITKDYYFKHTVDSNRVLDTSICLHVNNREFCMDKDYWDTDFITTKNKIENEFYNVIGETLSCEESEDDVIPLQCKLGNYSIGLGSYITAIILNNNIDSYVEACYVLKDGTSLCDSV